MFTMETVLAALHVGSVSELLCDLVLWAIAFTLPFLLGVLYGIVTERAERRQVESDKRAAARELRRAHNEYIRDMLRQIEELESPGR